MPEMITFFDGEKNQTIEKSKFIEKYPNMGKGLLEVYEAREYEREEEYKRYREFLISIQAKIDTWNSKAYYHQIDRDSIEVKFTN